MKPKKKRADAVMQLNTMEGELKSIAPQGPLPRHSQTPVGPKQPIKYGAE